MAELGRPTDTPNLLTQVQKLQAELDSLRSRYDELRKASDRAAERYKSDYQKWRNFKQWLFEDFERDDEVRKVLKSNELRAYPRASMLGKRKQFEVIGPDLNGFSDGEENQKKKSGVASGSDLWNRHLPHEMTVVDRNHESSAPEVAKTESSRTAGSESDPPFKVESSGKFPTTGGSARKPRGRYAQVASAGIPTINSKFSIRKDLNQGLDFPYDAVVRSRKERRHMEGDDCECCHDYYKAIGPVPSPQRPLWRSPKRKRNAYSHSDDDKDKENADDIDQHKHRVSRHRHHWHRPKTPPAYWEIGFPDTQEASDINRRAAAMHEKKLVDIEVEAR
ncbi:DNA repair protein endonuclease SAE2/CtIP C-terminus-domain-containing protein [Pisolithus croceorrhizus]|nr:DNA repair protein endonuclease SAE2/CtIP C-terminus-domain-containing protein [Pisolithus croceorrhizus]KAI6164359.1 DNA repair protein endonuclease SAE2/CtIP C-terminus-domain-containing protein [Pisolithus thermaeus]